MEIKAIRSATAYEAVAATEARDERRHRDRDSSPSKDSQTPPKATTPKVEEAKPSAAAPIPAADDALPSQMVDSNTVIEMLNHRSPAPPQDRSHLHRLFKNVKRKG